MLCSVLSVARERKRRRVRVIIMQVPYNGKCKKIFTHVHKKKNIKEFAKNSLQMTEIKILYKQLITRTYVHY